MKNIASILTPAIRKGPFTGNFRSFLLLIFISVTLWNLIAPPMEANAASSQSPSTSAYQSESQTRYLNLRILLSVKDETLEHLARICKPTVIYAKKGQSIIEIFRQFYGFYDEKSTPWKLFRQYNEQLNNEKLNSLTSDMNLSMPAGPHWEFEVKKKIPAGQILSDVLKRYMGEQSIGPKTTKRINELNPSFKGQPDQRLARSQEITIPYITKPYTYELVSQYDGKTDDELLPVTNPLEEDGRVLWLGVSDTPSLIHSFSVVNTAAEVTPVSSQWLQNAIRFPYQDNLQFFNTCVVAVVDTGIVKDIPELKSNLWENQTSNIYCKDDTIGCNCLTMSGFPEDDLSEDSKHRYHGTHVAGIAAGWPIRAQLPGQFQGIQEHLRLMILKVVNEEGQVDFQAFCEALYYAAKNRVPIVNLSLQTSKPGNMYGYLMGEQFGQVLFVVAAGNGVETGGQFKGINLDGTSIYPAVLTQEYENVITVGAYDESGKMSTFSNFGEQTVDLLAPGNAIKSIIGNEQLLTLSGTSQATPFVTFTAAALRAQMTEVEPYLLKQRILSSVDYDAGLYKKVRSSGRLNIAKALSVNKDLIELDNHEFIRGKLSCFTPLDLPQENQSVKLLQKFGIRKIVFRYSDAQQNNLLVFTGGLKRQVELNPVKLQIPGLVIERDDGSKLKVRPDAILDFVPKMYGSDVKPCTGYSINPLRTNLSLSNQPNAKGWNKTDVTLDFKVMDGDAAGTSVDKIVYTINGARQEIEPDSSLKLSDGVSNISYYAVDKDGYREYPAHLTVIRVDTHSPSLTLPGEIRVEASGSDGATIAFQERVVVSDNLDLNPAISCSPPSGHTFPVGETAVTCKASDASDNTVEDSFKVFVVDSQPPIITIPPDITIPASTPDGAIVTFGITVKDIGDLQPSITCDKAAGAFPVGISKITCKAIDASGNQSFASFQIKVVSSAEQLLEINAWLTGLNLNKSVEDKLRERLEKISSAVSMDFSSACKRVDDVLKAIDKQSGEDQMADEIKESFVKRLNQLRSAIGCK
jgi:hypothetical protein